MSEQFDGTLGGKYPANYPWCREQNEAYFNHLQAEDLKFGVLSQVQRGHEQGRGDKAAARLSAAYPQFADDIAGLLQDLKASGGGDGWTPEANERLERRVKDWLDSEGHAMMARVAREEGEKRKLCPALCQVCKRDAMCVDGKLEQHNGKDGDGCPGSGLPAQLLWG